MIFELAHKDNRMCISRNYRSDSCPLKILRTSNVHGQLSTNKRLKKSSKDLKETNNNVYTHTTPNWQFHHGNSLNRGRPEIPVIENAI